jgi:hypothetical protein
MAMMLFFAAAALATMPSLPRFSAVAEATATIRVVTGVVLKLDGSPNPNAPPVRDSTTKSADGSTLPIKLIEFQ